VTIQDLGLDEDKTSGDEIVLYAVPNSLRILPQPVGAPGNSAAGKDQLYSDQPTWVRNFGVAQPLNVYLTILMLATICETI